MISNDFLVNDMNNNHSPASMSMWVPIWIMVGLLIWILHSVSKFHAHLAHIYPSKGQYYLTQFQAQPACVPYGAHIVTTHGHHMWDPCNWNHMGPTQCYQVLPNVHLAHMCPFVWAHTVSPRGLSMWCPCWSPKPYLTHTICPAPAFAQLAHLYPLWVP